MRPTNWGKTLADILWRRRRGRVKPPFCFQRLVPRLFMCVRTVFGLLCVESSDRRLGVHPLWRSQHYFCLLLLRRPAPHPPPFTLLSSFCLPSDSDWWNRNSRYAEFFHVFAFQVPDWPVSNPFFFLFLFSFFIQYYFATLVLVAVALFQTLSFTLPPPQP